jgi:hypothetical protein
MKKAILLALLMPCMASGQIVGNLKPGDIIISEIMADPTPVVSLPDQEYFEITNTSRNPVNMQGWKLIAGTQTITFPEFVIQPSEYVIICSPADTILFSAYGRTLGLRSFPALTNEGKLLCLTDRDGTLVHGVEYSSTWYGDALKSDGGWSLEMIDTHFPFAGKDNWGASVSKTGGTPGMPNSLNGSNPDLMFHGILNTFPEDNRSIRVKFSETLFICNEDAGSLKIDNNSIPEIYPADPLMREYIIKTSEPLGEGTLYTLSISDQIRDMAGNPMEVNTFGFGITSPPGTGDILFNELLFNPLPGDADYIEFYNLSSKILDASDFVLASVNDATGAVSSSVAVSAERRCILPHSYYAITTDPERIISRYFSSDPSAIFKTGSFPSMPDREGHLKLMNRSLEKIDEVKYNESMHFPLLSGVEGIALEKIRPDGPSYDQGSWHSASEASGWGTPGRVNSVYTDKPVSSDEVHLSSTRITPDNDGFEDLLVIDLKMKGNGNVVSVTIFNETGGFIRQLADNLFAGSEAAIAWDGTAADGSPLRNGIYILLITVFDGSGKSKQWKRICTVVR